jgi:hypothetical protein
MSYVGINPRNKTEKQIIEICTRAHNWLAKELDVDSSQEFGRTALWGKDAFHGGLWISGKKQSVLNFRNLYGENVKTMLNIVSHELRHAYQYANGMMRDDNIGRSKGGMHVGVWECGYWNDKYYSGVYREAPWEIDARAHEETYTQMIIDSGVVSAKELDIILPGARTTYYNESEKQEQFSNNSKERIHWFKAATISKAQSDKNDKLLHKAFSDAGFIAPTSPKGNWSFGKVSKAQQVVMDKEWKFAKKQFATKYRKDAVAYLTDSKYKSIASKDQFWEAQKNILEFDTVELAVSALTY